MNRWPIHLTPGGCAGGGEALLLAGALRARQGRPARARRAHLRPLRALRRRKGATEREVRERYNREREKYPREGPCVARQRRVTWTQTPLYEMPITTAVE